MNFCLETIHGSQQTDVDADLQDAVTATFSLLMNCARFAS